MRHPRSVNFPRLILALLLVVSILAPEGVHSFLHHHAAEHRGDAEHHGDAGHHGAASAQHQPAAAPDHQHGDAHPHLELTAVPCAKLSPGQAMIAQLVLLAIQPPDTGPPVLVPPSPGALPGGWDHGLPPPSRAPPLV